jgi:putative hemolysin
LNLFQEVIFSVLLMPVLLALSAFFSCSETALFSLTPESARRLRGTRHSEELLKLFHREPSELLAAILLGNLFVNVLFFCTGAMAISRLAEAYGEWFEALGGLIVLLAVILFGEIIPKAMGITLSGGIVRMASVPLRYWFVLTSPLRRLIRWTLDRLHLGVNRPLINADLTQGELKELLDAVRHEPGFGAQEKAILEDIVNLSEIRVREVMVPRVRVLSRSLAADRRGLLQEAGRNEFSCVVIYRDDDNDLLGYINIGELFADSRNSLPIESFIRPLVFVPETKRVDVLLREFMTNGWRLAAVVDEYGGFSGIVTMEDLFAEVVGGFEPEEAEEIIKLDEMTYRLSGQLPIREWKDLLTGILPGHDVGSLAFDTLGGFVTSLLGRIPAPSDTVIVRNLRLTVESMQHSRVETVLLHLNQPEETP